MPHASDPPPALTTLAESKGLPRSWTRGMSLLLAALGMLVAGFLVFWHEQVWDDHLLLAEPRVLGGLSWKGLEAAFSRSYWDGTGQVGATVYWRPLLTLSFQLEQTLYGGSARGMHLLNVLLHVLCCLGLWRVVRALLLQSAVSEPQAEDSGRWAGLIFGLHPLTVESWAWISGRTDLGAMGFGLLSLLLTARIALEDRRQAHAGWAEVGFAWVTGGALLAGLLCKEVAIVFALLIPLWPGLSRRCLLRLAGPLGGALGLYGLARVLAAGAPAGAAEPGNLATNISVESLGALLRAGVSLGHYTRMLVWPFNPSALPATKTLDVPTLALGLLVGAGVLGLLWRFRRDVSVRFVWGWVLGGLLPVLNLVPLDAPSPVAERFWYVPLGGVLAGVMLLVQRLRFTLPAGRAAAGGVLVLLVLSSVSGLRASEWRTDLTLWEAEAARHGLRHLLTARNLGVARRDAGDLEGARDCWLQALSQPDGVPKDERYELGLLLAQLLLSRQEGAEAIRWIDALLQEAPPPALAGKLMGLRAQGVVGSVQGGPPQPPPP